MTELHHEKAAYDVAIIGGGASGLFAAALLRDGKKKVVLLEKNEKLGKKLFITGKGRCNLTNQKPPSEFLTHVCSNPRFLYSSLHAFDSYALMDFFETHSLKLKVERGDRVFPASDKSSDVIKTLQRCIDPQWTTVCLQTKVTAIQKKKNLFVIQALHQQNTTVSYRAEHVVLATGALSYPLTGSTGDGYAFARSFGHRIMPLRPALVAWESPHAWVHSLAGLTLHNVRLSILQRDKPVKNTFGECLFTHTGISGPAVLYLSSYVPSYDDLQAVIDLKPALDPQKLEQRVLRDFEANANKTAKYALDLLLPKRLAKVILSLCHIDLTKPIHQITSKERKSLVCLMKALPLSISGHAGYEQAVITQGGVCTKEIDPKTMRSKLVDGLYVVGELLDVDASTGGYNLQIAFSTAYACVQDLCRDT